MYLGFPCSNPQGTLDAIAGMTTLASLQLDGFSLELLLERAIPIGIVELHACSARPLGNATLLQLAALTRLERLSMWSSLETSVPRCLLALPHLTVSLVVLCGKRCPGTTSCTPMLPICLQRHAGSGPVFQAVHSCAAVHCCSTQHLDLKYNPGLASLPITAVPSAASQLECLALNLCPAVRVLDQLLRLTALQRLSLCCNSAQVAQLTDAEVLLLLDAVGRLPQLHTLNAFGNCGRGMLSMSHAVSEAYGSLARQHACLRFVFDEEFPYHQCWAD